MEYNDFVEKYCRWVESVAEERLSLKEKSNFDCIFWDRGCIVYNARPLQCRNFPFWESIVNSSYSWKIAASGCPGIGKGALHNEQEIESALERRKSEPIISRQSAGGRV